MSKGYKYIRLKRYLKKSKLPMVILTFRDIEKIIHSKLPKSAYDYSEQWWSNDYDHFQAVAWINAGYETEFVIDTYKDEKIVFVKQS